MAPWRACWPPARPTSPVSRGRATSRPHAAWASPRAGRWPTHGSSRSTRKARRSRPSPAIFPENTTLLVDTYDTLEGVRHAAAIEPPVRAIRIDSGDLGKRRRQARTILDQLGRSSVKIIASGDLDEYKIAQLVASGAPVDGFGVGTELITSRDAPALAMVYKLVELDGEGKFKLSPGKTNVPDGQASLSAPGPELASSVVTMSRRPRRPRQGSRFSIPILRSGRLVTELPTLESIRARCRDQLAALPERLLGLDAQPDYPITYSEALEAHARRLMKC